MVKELNGRQESRLRTQVAELDVREEARLKRKNRWAIAFHLAMALLIVIPAVVFRTKQSALMAFAVTPWVLLSGLKEVVINRNDYVIAMVRGIQQIEFDTIEDLTKERADGNTNAKRNRKK